MAPGAMRPTTAHSRSRQVRVQEGAATKFSLPAAARPGSGNVGETGFLGPAPRGAGASSLQGNGPRAAAEVRPLSGINRGQMVARSASASRIRFGSGESGTGMRKSSSCGSNWMSVGGGDILDGRTERISDAWADLVGPPQVGNGNGRVSSRALSRPGTAGSYTSLSPMTKNQNVKAEKDQEHIIQSEREMHDVSRAKRATIKDPLALDREFDRQDFDEQLQSANGMLEELGKKIRMEGVSDLKSRKEMERERQRQEELRKRAEHERRLREQAKEAQNPKKRVALHVEQQREFGDEKSLQKVPMLFHEVQGEGGTERVPIVNVRMLQARSLGLNTGSPSFNSIYELQGQKEKTEVWERRAFGRGGDKVRDHIRKNRAAGVVQCRTKQSLEEWISEKERRTEHRHLSALKKRKQQQEDRAMRQLENMRSEWTLRGGLCCSADTAKALKEIAYVAAEYAARGTIVQDMPRMSVRPYMRLKLDNDEDLDSPGRDSPGTARRKATKELQPARTSLRWTLVRSAFYLICWLAMLRKKHVAIEIARNCLYQAATIKLIGDTCRRMNSRVRKLQSVTRMFIARKRAWSEQTARLWIHYEDQYLEKNAKVPEIKDTQADYSPKRPATPVPEWWKCLRIPAEHRKAALGRWYISQLRTKVQMQTGFMSVVETAHFESRDLQRFFSLCGLEYSEQPQEVEPEINPGHDKKKSSKKAKLKEWLAIGEQEIMELIAIAAQELRRVDPFQEHPLNKNVPRERPPSGSGRRQRQSVMNLSRIRASLAAGSFGGGKGDKSSRQDTKELRPMDVDELFRRFTPRLRHIQATPRESDDLEDDLDFLP